MAAADDASIISAYGCDPDLPPGIDVGVVTPASAPEVAVAAPPAWTAHELFEQRPARWLRFHNKLRDACFSLVSKAELLVALLSAEADVGASAADLDLDLDLHNSAKERPRNTSHPAALATAASTPASALTYMQIKPAVLDILNMFDGLVTTLENHSQWEETALFPRMARHSPEFADAAGGVLYIQHGRWDRVAADITHETQSLWTELRPVVFPPPGAASATADAADHNRTPTPLPPPTAALTAAHLDLARRAAARLLTLLRESQRQLRIHLATEEQSVVPVWLRLTEEQNTDDVA